MNRLFFHLILLISFSAFSQKNYILQIDGKEVEISLDKINNVKINGKNVELKVTPKDTMLYKDEFYSFKHIKDYKVSKIIIDQGIEQISIITADGAGVIIQKYSTINPTSLNEMMLAEVTKESITYGYMMRRANYNLKLKSGQDIEVDKAILTYKDETSIYEVASIGKKDEGIMIMTMIPLEGLTTKGKEIIKLMWDSLKYE